MRRRAALLNSARISLAVIGCGLVLAGARGVLAQAPAVSLSRTWVEVMTSLKIPHQYIQVPGGDHGSVITSHQADVFAFFAEHKR